MSESVHQIQFIANPTQQAFIESRSESDLWACRMGEGKSAGLCWSCWYHTRHNPHAIWAFIRDTWVNCRDTTQKEFFEWFPPGVYGTYNADRKTFTWAAEGMRGEVVFMGLDDPSDAHKLQSRPLGGFAMDEPAPAAESGGISLEIFDVAMTRLRQKGMKWYAAKLAENAPDETHWTYQRFVDPGDEGTPTGVRILSMQERGYRYYRSTRPENTKNLPPGYYASLRQRLKHRPDLVRRFAEGGFGFQQIGRAVTPEWNDALHVADDLRPVYGAPLLLCWDFGLNPTCVVTQFTPLGHWNVLEAWVGDEIGVLQLVESVVKPALSERYQKLEWSHTGDPAGMQREQSSSEQTAVKVIKAELGGAWRPGPVRVENRIDPLRRVLSQTRNAKGLVQVDRERAKPVIAALRGGWHYPVSRTGQVNQHFAKDIHSHPGEAVSYGAAKLFPTGKLRDKRKRVVAPKSAHYGIGARDIGAGIIAAQKAEKVLRERQERRT